MVKQAEAMGHMSPQAQMVDGTWYFGIHAPL